MAWWDPFISHAAVAQEVEHTLGRVGSIVQFTPAAPLVCSQYCPSIDDL